MNDCAAGAHSCAGQSTVARDPKSRLSAEGRLREDRRRQADGDLRPTRWPRIPPGPVPAAAGIGLRFPHHHAVLEQRPAVGWMEVHPENYFGGGAAVAALEAVRRDWPVTLHGVGLSLGSAEGLDARHLARLAALAARIEPGLISEHVAWSVAGGTYLADLLPLPMTEEALDVVCRNVETMRSALGRQVLVENPSSYLHFAHATNSRM